MMKRKYVPVKPVALMVECALLNTPCPESAPARNYTDPYRDAPYYGNRNIYGYRDSSLCHYLGSDTVTLHFTVDFHHCPTNRLDLWLPNHGNNARGGELVEGVEDGYRYTHTASNNRGNNHRWELPDNNVHRGVPSLPDWDGGNPTTGIPGYTGRTSGYLTVTERNPLPCPPHKGPKHCEYEITLQLSGDGTFDLPPPAEPEITLGDPKGFSEEPISGTTGDLFFKERDLSAPLPGLPLEFTRHYHSTLAETGALGRCWTHRYDWSADRAQTVHGSVTAEVMRVRTGTGKIHTFHPDGSGGFEPAKGLNWTLCGNATNGYTLSVPPDLEYAFNGEGRLDHIRRLSGPQIDLSYTNLPAGERLIEVSHPAGKSLNLSYSNGLLRSATLSTNLAVSCEYTASGQLRRSERTGEGAALTRTYDCAADGAGVITQRVDGLGHVYRYGYTTNLPPARGTSLSINDQWYAHQVDYEAGARPEDPVTAIAYNLGDVTVTNLYYYEPFFGQIIEQHGPFADPAEGGPSVRFDHDLAGNTTNETRYAADTNLFIRTWSQYDARNNRTLRGTGYGTDPRCFESMTYDTHNLLQVLTDASGLRTEFDYTNGLVAAIRTFPATNRTTETRLAYTTHGLLAAVTNANGHWTRHYYDASGFRTSSVPQAGPALSFAYNELGHLVRTERGGVCLASNRVDALGRVLEVRYPDGTGEQFARDAHGRVTNHVDRAGRVTTTRWYPTGKVREIGRVCNGTNLTIRYAYDPLFHTLSITDRLDRAVETYRLDLQGRVEEVTNLEGQQMSVSNGVGDYVLAITRFDGTEVGYDYDRDGRRSEARYPDATNIYTYASNGLLRTAGDATGSVSNRYDGAGRLIGREVDRPGEDWSLAYGYDPAGNRTNAQVSCAGTNLLYSWGIDAAERVDALSGPGSDWTLAYDPTHGRLASISATNAGVWMSRHCDVMDRVTNLLWHAGSTVALEIKYGYDAAGMITSRVIRTAATTNRASYAYDALERLRTGTRGENTMTYRYDAAGNRTSKRGGDWTVDYTRGAGNRLAAWTATSSNDFASLRTFDVLGSSSEPIGTNGAFGYLQISNAVSCVTPEVSGAVFRAEDFVVGWSTQEVTAAIRDAAGNMGYATHTLVLGVVTNAQYGYDAAGCVTNITCRGHAADWDAELRWDGRYRLTSVTLGGLEIEHEYDLDGRRTRREVRTSGATNTVHYIYDGEQVVAEIDESGTLRRTYVWAPEIDRLLSFTDYESGATNTYYALTDPQGTVHALLDETGAVAESYEYNAWGRVEAVRQADGEELTRSALANRYLWQGREYDWALHETTGGYGLYQFRARWYDPVTGRFLSKDPIGINGGLNQYVFCGNDPVNGTDPFGLCDSGQDTPRWWEYFIPSRIWYGPYGGANMVGYYRRAGQSGMRPENIGPDAIGYPQGAPVRNWLDVTYLMHDRELAGAKSPQNVRRADARLILRSFVAPLRSPGPDFSERPPLFRAWAAIPAFLVAHPGSRFGVMQGAGADGSDQGVFYLFDIDF
ncbi:RHS repeat-associated core domain-containing protein [Kiritimatiella glycovorans]|uniref:Cell wall-associated polypeptide CWBP200 n=1 Tax=Kiritimatiella glycovorans TaxID=1307763 RepID=A0A0G3EDG8_9BACT|nr:RHS repeat-associated core domain-containing protein [Kiritimatiella glycovorans]AKJ63427.1 Cell wall-associated polypeptide CWBP200 [Kiritimatiella glycovorans]